MKALTVQQPWAWAIVHGGKGVENRTQAWSYRGPLAIHAGARWSDRGGRSPLIVRHPAYADAPMAKGAIIGVVDLVDAHKATDDCVLDGPCGLWGWYVFETDTGPRDVVHLVLEHPRPLRQPIPARGRLGLWNLDGEQLAQLVGTGAISGMECA